MQNSAELLPNATDELDVGLTPSSLLVIDDRVD
jgi:hypothetical protein